MSTTQRLTEIEAQEKALANEKAKLLAASKDADLEMHRPVLSPAMHEFHIVFLGRLTDCPILAVHP